MHAAVRQLLRGACAERWLEPGAEYAQKESALPVELQKGFRIDHSSNLCNGGAESLVTSATDHVLHLSTQPVRHPLSPFEQVEISC